MSTAMSRSKDFDDTQIGADINLNYQDVTVRSLSWKDSLVYSQMREKNSDSVFPYEIIDMTKRPKISLAINYQGLPAGEICIWNIRENEKACMISYWVDESLRRKKIATRAVALVTDYCLLELDMEEIEAPVLEDNKASKELLMKLSYSIAGYETFTGKDGIQRPHETYLLVKPENGIVYSLIDFLEMMAQPPAE